jgi:hypothetical protein
MPSVNLVVYRLIISLRHPADQRDMWDVTRDCRDLGLVLVLDQDATKKGNTKNITSITDLTRDGLKIALEHVNATAIGKATAKLLEWLSAPSLACERYASQIIPSLSLSALSFSMAKQVKNTLT